MFKLLLVDDEPIIVEGLYELFSGYTADSLDVYKAYSAQEALNWLNKKRIDVVISDIMMPEMNGLQLLEKIRQSWPQCKVIFLTGHDEFSYIYEAVRYSGVSYLLKSESNDNILAMVERYFEDIKNSYRNEELIQSAEIKLKKALPILQKEFLSDLMDGAELDEISQRQLDELEIPLRFDEPVLLLVGRIVDPQGKEGKSSLYSVNSTIEQCFSSSASLCGLIHQKDYVVWLLQRNPDSDFATSEETALYFRNVLESVQCACRESFGLKVSFAISGQSVPWSQIFFNYIDLKPILNSSLRQGMEVIALQSLYGQSDAASEKQSGDQKCMLLHLKKLDGLANCLELGKEDEFFRIFAELKNYFVRNVPVSGVDEEVYYTISLLFISYINRHNLKDVVSQKLNSDRLWYRKSYTTMEDAFGFFGQIAQALFGVQIVETEKRSLASIQDVQNYIQKNLEKDLSLNSLADMVFFNPKYLSRLFKQTTGINLSDYINEKRLAKARGLLRQSHIRIYEIAQAVGYSSNSYFTMFFKKGTNMTPQEYRDSCIK